MTILLTEVYDVTLKKDAREAAKNGFIRPTIGESFMSHKDFVEVVSIPVMQPTYFRSTTSMSISESNLRATSNGTWAYADLAGFKESGKWFVEFQNLNGDGWAGPVNPDYNAGYGYQRGQSIHVVNNYPTLGCIYSNNAYVGPIGAVNWFVGSYLGIAYDMGTGEIKVYINGDLKATYTVVEAYRPAKMTFSYCAMTQHSAKVTPTRDLVHYPIPSGYLYYGE